MANLILTEREYTAIQRAAVAAGPIQQAATTWRCMVVSRETSSSHILGEGITQTHLDCRACGQSVYQLPVNEPLSIAWGTVLDHLAGHIRQCHEDTLDLP